ncbi:hypothetical protein AVEN_201473-1 [Araneus ventricosus]|uniref:Uncharacterized protein n=1 Tax=Araneus ventricosus TaxID=182803 RepID=A0A4Y2GKX5_ARAVE|nr:hypothetical protein AVEN_201473-1 [Araneus ventricosus]
MTLLFRAIQLSNCLRAKKRHICDAVIPCYSVEQLSWSENALALYSRHIQVESGVLGEKAAPGRIPASAIRVEVLKNVTVWAKRNWHIYDACFRAIQFERYLGERKLHLLTFVLLKLLFRHCPGRAAFIYDAVIRAFHSVWSNCLGRRTLSMTLLISGAIQVEEHCPGRREPWLYL